MNILQRIVADSRRNLEARKKLHPATELVRQIADAPARASLSAALRRPGINVIAELKKASPSQGMIRRDFPVEALALELADAGAAALSVLTEENYFLGAPENLLRAARTVELPLLCKDFISDPYQILEARRNGASAVLLIAAMLDHVRLCELAETAHRVGMEVLVEAHDEREIGMIRNSPADIIGINARDLKDFSTSLDRVGRLIESAGVDRPVVAESAIKSKEDIAGLIASGAHGFLIGTALMKSAHPGAVLKGLL